MTSFGGSSTNQYGNRTFPVLGSSGEYVRVYDGDVGWSAFLDAIVRPVIENELRQGVNAFRCQELISSCAFVVNQGKNVSIGTTNGNNANIAKAEEQINSGLQTDLDQTLGVPYFTNIHFNLSRITLPDDIQTSINEAQGAFAQVAKAQASVQAAQLQAQAAAQRARGYRICGQPCALLDQINALQNLSGSVTVILGQNSGVTIPAK